MNTVVIAPHPDDEAMAHKLRAVRSHASQFLEIDYASAIKGLNQYRGQMSGKFRFAEDFQTLEPDA